MVYGKICAFSILLLWHFIQINCEVQWSQKFVKLVEIGRERMQDIAMATEDTDRECLLDSWTVVNLPQVSLGDKLQGSLKRTSDLGNMSLRDNLYNIDAMWPAQLSEEKDVKSKLQALYDPTSGTIVHQNDLLHPEHLDPGLTTADVSWALYKAAWRADNSNKIPIKYPSIRHIVYSNSMSEDTAEVFRELWAAASEQLRTRETWTYKNPGSDHALALLGLSNSSWVSDLLQDHSQEMGNRRIQSVSVLFNGPQYDFWYTLADNKGPHDSEKHMCESWALGKAVNCYNGSIYDRETGRYIVPAG